MFRSYSSDPTTIAVISRQYVTSLEKAIKSALFYLLSNDAYVVGMVISELLQAYFL